MGALGGGGGGGGWAASTENTLASIRTQMSTLIAFCNIFILSPSAFYVYLLDK
jgi:hypothetical protein